MPNYVRQVMNVDCDSAAMSQHASHQTLRYVGEKDLRVQPEGQTLCSTLKHGVVYREHENVRWEIAGHVQNWLDKHVNSEYRMYDGQLQQ